MNPFGRVGVFLMGAPADAAELAHARVLIPKLKVEHVHFIHVQEDSLADCPPPPTAEAFRDQVTAVLGPIPGVSIGFEVDPGKAITEVLCKADELDLDLIILGRRLPSGVLSVGSRFARLARKAPCSVLLIPEGVTPHLSRLLVAVDFSEGSKRALETAIRMALASAQDRPQVVCQHVFDVHYGHRYAGATLEEVTHDIETHRRREFDRFLASVDTGGVSVELLLTASHEPATAVLHVAAIRKMDVVLVGSRGHSFASTLLMGGFSEQILVAAAAPVMIVKQKGETRGFLKAIKDLV